MKYASDFRYIARNSLRGKWGVAIIAGLLASLLGGIASNGPQLNLEFDEADIKLAIEYANQKIYTFGTGWSDGLLGILTGGLAVVAVVALVLAVAYFILGSVIEVGYAQFNLDLVDGQKLPEAGTLFGYFPHWKTLASAKLLQTVYIFLWSLLLIIPGIVAGYSYAMTGYILAENPQLTAGEAIARSKEMMAGNRGRLFCLQLSFIGWGMLSALTLGLGDLWLTPYRQAATAAFYREVSGTESVLESPAPEQM